MPEPSSQPDASASHVKALWLVLTGLLVFALLAAGALTHRKGDIKWDGGFYYSSLRSGYFDGDLDFHNEARAFPFLAKSFAEPLPNGLLANPFSLGPSLLWLPFYVCADALALLLPGVERTGYGFPYAQSIYLATCLYVALGVLLQMLFYRKLRLPAAVIFGLPLAALLATPAIFYAIALPEYAHGLSFFSCSLVLYLLGHQMSDPKNDRLLLCLLAGMAAGLTFLVRWQNALLAGVPLAWLLYSGLLNRRLSFWRRLALPTLLFGAGFFLLAGLQCIYWKILYGHFFRVPQGEGFLSLAHVEPLRFLFSTRNGLFSTHPILLVGLLGLCALLTKVTLRQKLLLAVFLLVFTMEVLLSMMVRDWWAGGAFGQRRLLGMAPFVICGLLFYLRQPRLRHVVVASLCVLTLWNLLTFSLYFEHKLPFNPYDPNWYSRTQRPYGHFEHGRRLVDILTGREP